MGEAKQIEVADLTEVDGFGPVDLYQKREKIITRSTSGWYQYLRWFTGWPLLFAYFGAPHLYWEGRQAILFDLGARQFHLFDLTFWPEDLWLCGWLLIIGAFSLFTVTTLLGRVWCGFTCPQTVWTAMFMWIEQFAEGTRSARIKLEKAPMSFSKARKRSVKHGLWLGLAFLTGVTFVGYFTPIHELVLDFVNLEVGGWALFWTLFFTLATYGNAGWMREQVCIYMCPYARFQSAMFDHDTMIVAYDAGRGEPRSAAKRGLATDAGDCVNCSICVQVCPTGIDIRDGLQYQCISCAHCIDACNEVMRKVDRPEGLIRFTSESELAGKGRHWLRPRSVGYATAALAMCVAFSVAVLSRDPLMVEIVRGRGDLYQMDTRGQVANDYLLKLTNKTARPMVASVALKALPGAAVLALEAESDLPLAPRESKLTPLRVIAAAEALAGLAGSRPLEFEVCLEYSGSEQEGRCSTEPSLFFAPTSHSAGLGGR
ncbi:MAG: cytochrome c oxidase accessory protein CcoG [Pseudomonadota bacterium]